MSIVNIMVGIPGSGKSTKVNQIVNAWNHKQFVIICPDEIREELCNGNRGDQTKNKKVWETAYDRLILYLKTGKDVIFDATMVSSKDRKIILEICKDYNACVYAHVVNTDIEVAKKQNENRKWKVPESVIDRMYSRFEMPTLTEGFNYITIY